MKKNNKKKDERDRKNTNSARKTANENFRTLPQ
jgi:hypothetical protein